MKTLLSPTNFTLELRRDLKLVDSKITKAMMIPDIEKTWLRNEECFTIYGKSFEFFKKWEGDASEAKILYNGDIDVGSDALFDKNATTYVTRQGATKDVYEIIFNDPILIHAITIGTVRGVTRYAKICFKLFSSDSKDQPDFEICTGGKPEYDIITLMIDPIMISTIQYHFKNDDLYKISSLAIYHRG